MARDSRREKLETRFLTITSIVVGLLAVPTFLSFLREPSNLNPKIINLQDRSPASVDTHAATNFLFDKNQSLQNTVETFKIDCKSPQKEINTQAHQIRLVATDCPEAFKLLEVVNKANGFTASLFQGNKNISTDFIDLNMGENSLQLNAQNSNQSKILLINRRAPASIND